MFSLQPEAHIASAMHMGTVPIAWNLERWCVTSFSCAA